MSAESIYIEHEDGTVWKVPAKTIAFKRADHYADKATTSTGGESYDTTFEEEMEAALEDPFMLTDYLRNNMRWREVKKHASKVGEVATPPRRLPTAEIWTE